MIVRAKRALSLAADSPELVLASTMVESLVKKVESELQFPG